MLVQIICVARLLVCVTRNTVRILRVSVCFVRAVRLFRLPGLLLFSLLLRFAEWCGHTVDKSREIRVRAMLAEVIDEHDVNEEEQQHERQPLSPAAYAQQTRAKQQPARRPPTRHSLELDVLQERRQHVLFFLMMPSVEPDGAKLI